MYYRHLYAIQQPSLEARCESWANYTALFGVIIHGNVNMQLPNGWLWDMIDEFVYQFQVHPCITGTLTLSSRAKRHCSSLCVSPPFERMLISPHAYLLLYW